MVSLGTFQPNTSVEDHIFNCLHAACMCAKQKPLSGCQNQVVLLCNVSISDIN